MTDHKPVRGRRAGVQEPTISRDGGGAWYQYRAGVPAGRAAELELARTELDRQSRRPPVPAAADGSRTVTPARPAPARAQPAAGKPEPGKPEPGKPEPGKPEPGMPAAPRTPRYCRCGYLDNAPGHYVTCGGKP